MQDSALDSTIDPAFQRELEQALAGQIEFEPVWDRLGEVIAARPQDTRLLRWRLRLAEAAGLHRQRIDDLQLLVMLNPDDRDALLQLACAQHRYAHWLDDEDGSDDADAEADEQAAEQAIEERRLQALGWCETLAARHVADAGFMGQLLSDENSPLRSVPWQRLRWLLQAQALAPQDTALQRLLALAWCDLAGHLPPGCTDERPPVGFLVDAFGNVMEALMVERALGVLAPLIDAAPQDIELRQQRATLRVACGRHAEAVDDHLAIAQAWDAQAQAAQSAGDAHEQQDCRDRAGHARDEAARCAQGPEALVQGALSAMDGLLAQLGRFDGAAGDAAHRPDEESLQRREALRTQFDGLRPQVDAASREPAPADKARLDELASSLSKKMSGLLPFDAVQYLPLSPSDFEQPLDAWLAATGEALAEQGWHALGCCENPAWRVLFKRQVVTALWADPAGTSIAVLSAAGALRVVDLESEFEEGLQVITSTVRGRSNYGSGPGVDQLALDPDAPLALLTAVHQARVAYLAARRPGAVPLQLRSVADFSAMQERQRLGKLAYRLSEGISEFEARGIATDFPDYFVPALRRAVKKQFGEWARGRVAL